MASLYMLAGSLFTLAVGLPLQIYVARMLGPSGLGTFALFEAAVGTVTGLFGFGIAHTAARFIPAHLAASQFASVKGLVRIGAALLLAIGTAIYIAVLFAMPALVSMWPELAVHRSELMLMGLMIPLSFLIFFVQQSLRGFQEVRAIVAGLSIAQLATKAVLAVVLLALGAGLLGYIAASVAAAGVGVLYIGVKLYRRVHDLPDDRPSYSAWRDWFRYALIVYTGNLVGMAAAGLDRYLSAFFLGTAAVGVLVVARQLQNLPERFNAMLLTIGAPMLAAAHSRADWAERQHLYALMTDWSVRLSMPLLLFLLVFAEPVMALFGPDFAREGTLPLRILLVGQFVSLLCGPVGNIAFMSDLERPAVAVSIVETCLLVALLVVLTWRFQLVGTAMAVTTAMLFLNVANLVLVRRRLGLRWWDGRYAMWLPQLGAVAAFLFGLSHLTLLWDAKTLAAVLAGSYATAVAVNLLTGLHAEDRDLLRHVGAQFAR